MNSIILIAIVLGVLWIVAKVLGWVVGAAFNLLWIVAIVLFVIWLVQKIRTRPGSST